MTRGTTGEMMRDPWCSWCDDEACVCVPVLHERILFVERERDEARAEVERMRIQASLLRALAELRHDALVDFAEHRPHCPIAQSPTVPLCACSCGLAMAMTRTPEANYDE